MNTEKIEEKIAYYKDTRIDIMREGWDTLDFPEIPQLEELENKTYEEIIIILNQIEEDIEAWKDMIEYEEPYEPMDRYR